MTALIAFIAGLLIGGGVVLLGERAERDDQYR